jgi:hypothetical protein
MPIGIAATQCRETKSTERKRIMISRKIAIISLAFAGFAAPGLSSASWFPDPEAGTPGAISELERGSSVTRKEIADATAASKQPWVSGDGLYRYVGGDEAWQFIGAVYEWRDGRFVRVDALSKKR